MKHITPLGALLICAMIGLLTGKFGLWFPIGIVAFIAVHLAQEKRRRS